MIDRGTITVAHDAHAVSKLGFYEDAALPYLKAKERGKAFNAYTKRFVNRKRKLHSGSPIMKYICVVWSRSKASA